MRRIQIKRGLKRMNMSPADRPVTSVADQWGDERDVIIKYPYIYSGIS